MQQTLWWTMEEEPKQITLPIYFLPKFLFLLAVLAAIFLLASSCAPQPEYDIRGSWDYVMTADNGDTYDLGTITFEGKPAKGTYLQINIYEIEYDGEYKVSSNQIDLSGYENWTGTFNDANTITGTWSHDAEAEGTFEAIKK